MLFDTQEGKLLKQEITSKSMFMQILPIIDVFYYRQRNYCNNVAAWVIPFFLSQNNQ